MNDIKKSLKTILINQNKKITDILEVENDTKRKENVIEHIQEQKGHLQEKIEKIDKSISILHEKLDEIQIK